MEAETLMAGREPGTPRLSQRRYVLGRQGVMHAAQPFRYQGPVRAALPLTWQMTEEGAAKILQWLPMAESLYRAPARVLDRRARRFIPVGGHVSGPGLRQLPPAWEAHPDWGGWRLPGGRLHAAAIRLFDRHYKAPRYRAIPFLWSGLLPQEDYRSGSLRPGSEYIRRARDPEDRIDWDAGPQVAAICLDCKSPRTMYQ